MFVACGSIQSLWGVTLSSPIKATYLETLVKDPGQFCPIWCSTVNGIDGTVSLPFVK